MTGSPPKACAGMTHKTNGHRIRLSRTWPVKRPQSIYRIAPGRGFFVLKGSPVVLISSFIRQVLLTLPYGIGGEDQP
jgi:hypothetical protein